MMKTEAKAPKVPKMDPAEKKEIEKLFKAGLEAAMKDPEKFWDMENQRSGASRVSKHLATLPMVRAKEKGKSKGKQESLVSELNDLLDSVKDD